MILKTNAEICTAWLELKVEIKMCAFRYLGSILQKDGDIDEDVRHRIKLRASSVTRRYHKS